MVLAEAQRPKTEKPSVMNHHQIWGQSGVVDNVSNPNVVPVAVGQPDHTTTWGLPLKAAAYVDYFLT